MFCVTATRAIGTGLAPRIIGIASPLIGRGLRPALGGNRQVQHVGTMNPGNAVVDELYREVDAELIRGDHGGLHQFPAGFVGVIVTQHVMVVAITQVSLNEVIPIVLIDVRKCMREDGFGDSLNELRVEVLFSVKRSPNVLFDSGASVQSAVDPVDRAPAIPGQDSGMSSQHNGADFYVFEERLDADGERTEPGRFS